MALATQLVVRMRELLSAGPEEVSAWLFQLEKGELDVPTAADEPNIWLFLAQALVGEAFLGSESGDRETALRYAEPAIQVYEWMARNCKEKDKFRFQLTALSIQGALIADLGLEPSSLLSSSSFLGRFRACLPLSFDQARTVFKTSFEDTESLRKSVRNAIQVVQTSYKSSRLENVDLPEEIVQWLSLCDEGSQLG